MKKNKLLIFILSIVSISFSMFLVSSLINEMHDCTGDNCSICLLVFSLSIISLLTLILSSISFITALSIDFFLNIKASIIYVLINIKIFENLSFIPYKSLVSLKKKIQYSM